MITQTMVKPSFWIEGGVQLAPIRNIYLFKFTEELQKRLDELNYKKKNNLLKNEEANELNGLLELNQIFTMLNAKIIGEN